MAKVRFVADPTTKISTGVNGEYIVVEFPSGAFETDNIALIDLLLTLGVERADAKKSPSKPIASEDSD